MSDRLLFSSKIDLWILIVVLAPVAACFIGAVQSWPAVIGAYWWVGALLLVGIALPLWFLVTTRYGMTDSELQVSCGPLRWTISIGDIETVEPVRDLSPNPSFSLDRLRIGYAGGGSIEISPEPRRAFLQQLEYRRRQAGDGDVQSPAP